MDSTPTPASLGGPAVPRHSVLRALGPGEITVTGGFWGDLKTLTRDAIIEHCDRWMERVGWTANFDRVADGRIEHEHDGIEFVDSEIYKLLEAMAWQLGAAEDPELAERYRGLVARVAGAQSADGYLHTSFGHPGQPERYSNLEWGHELYCFGHLFQAAVARMRTGHDDELPAVARRLADHLWTEFGPGGRVAVCGHPEVEMALAELSRATGEPRYLELARLFIDRRGTGTLDPIRFGPEYFQDDVPVREATVLRGHAVRALYLAAGAVDVAVDEGDDDLLDAVRGQWAQTVARRTYLTGGVGAHHSDEAFGADYELPPDRAYSETCAGIASIMLNWRLMLAGGGSAHADLIERTLLNNVLASPRADGRAFFYTNTLHQRVRGAESQEDVAIDRAETSLRAPWFWVSCCPTNVARTLASVEYYFAAVDAEGLQLHQYGDYRVDTVLGSGESVSVSVSSGYPYDGDVLVSFERPVGEDFVLSLRVPSWAEGATVTVGHETVPAEPGLLRLRRAFAAGDTVLLHLPMLPRFSAPHPRIDAVRGQLAVERGPLVLCLESVDLPAGLETDAVELDPSQVPRSTEHGAIAVFRRRADEPPVTEWPYVDAPEPSRSGAPIEVPLVPYFSWANRGPSTMRVWMPAVHPVS